MDASTDTAHHDVHATEHFQYTMPVVAIFVIFVLGLAGALFPPLVASYFPKFDLNGKWIFRFFNGLAAGIVLGIGFIHSLPDSFVSFTDALSSDPTQTAQYAWPGFIAMMGALITFASEQFVHRYIGRFGAVHGDHDHGGHDHHHHDHEMPPISSRSVAEAKASPESPKTPEGGEPREAAIQVCEVEEVSVAVVDAKERKRRDSTSSGSSVEQVVDYYSELYVLLFGLSFHSLFVGIALGVSDNDWGLFTAIVFHQFFEGMALGSRVARAAFKRRLHIWLLDIVFSLAAPFGTAIGIGIRSSLEDNSRTYNLADGVFQALSAGILIYVSLVHMMKEEMERPEFRRGGPLLYAIYTGFALGAGTMSVIGIWA